VFAQLTLDDCFIKARANYPMIKQKELVIRSKDFTVANLRSNYLPQISLSGQATYQSAVTEVPIENPLVHIESLSKDQYKVYAELNQVLYDGGSTRRSSSIQEASSNIEDQKIEVELYKIKERIAQLFFGTLLINAQLDQLDLVTSDLENNLQRMESSIRNGLAFKTNADILKAEMLNVQQRKVEILASKRTYLQMLSMFINQLADESTIFVKPETPLVENEVTISRPENLLFNYQQQFYTAQNQLIQTKLNPRVNFFVQGGYGKPALNMLLNEFDTYYMGGLRFSWNLGGFYNNSREKQLLELNLQNVSHQKETFEFNTRLALRQQSNDITKLQDLIKIDVELIRLRTQIKTTAKAQLDNGVITATDYVTELNAEDQAKQNLLLHQIQLLMTQYNYKITSGN
jgi:outer membrane protein TolC